MKTKYINEQTFDISVRRGTSSFISFSLESEDIDFNDMHFDFSIFKDYEQNPLIKKTSKVIDDCVYLNLSPEESEILNSEGEKYGTYYYKIALHKGEEFRTTIIPRTFEEKPEFRVYPGFDVCAE